MSLTPPSQVTFFLAVLLTVFSLLVRYTHVDIPIVSGHSYETLLVGLLAATCGQPIPRILTSPSNLLRSPRGLDSTRNFLRAKFELRSRCTSPIGSLGGSHKARGSKPSPGGLGTVVGLGRSCALSSQTDSMANLMRVVPSRGIAHQLSFSD